MSKPEQNYGALLQRSLLAIDQLEAKLAAMEGAAREPIAIVGMGCRFAGGVHDPDAFWQLLRDGVDAVTEVPAERWDVEAYFDADPDAPGKSYTRWGSFIDKVDCFDAQFFGISPREAAGLDPQQRLLLEVTWEALERAGIAPASLAGSQAGVFIGIATHDYMMRAAEAGAAVADAYSASGTVHSMAAGRLSYLLGLHGPSIAIDTACSSSLVAIHGAVQSLRSGEINLALTGGVSLMLTPYGSIVTSRARMMSPDGRCKTFDAAADGYVRGEGCGMLVLKRLSDALRDGDRVRALIRGSASNQDGRSSGLTAPNGLAQEAAVRAALANAGLQPEDIGYVETHGTGTSLGDPIEVKALGEVFGKRSAARPLLIGSVKTNIGHAEAAAGIAGLIKAVLALQHGEVPPHLHLKCPNPLIEWGAYPVTVPTQLTPWPADTATRRAGVSSFGFSGTNAHLVLEEAPPRNAAADGAGAAQLLVLSAQTEPALAVLAAGVAERLQRPEVETLSEVAATLAFGRSHLGERLAVVAADREQARERLLAAMSQDTRLAGTSRGRSSGGSAHEVVFLFTGQGAQYAGMARELYASQPVFHGAMDACASLVDLEQPLLPVIFGDADAARLDDTAYTQPALFALEYSLAQLWRVWGVEPTAVMGHSVGEYVAACIAGVFSLAEGLRLIVERGRLMSRLPRDGAMAAVFADEATVSQAIGDEPRLSIAAVNGPQNIVVSGASGALDGVLARFEAAGIEFKRLNVSHAFHSPLMAPMLDAFEQAASHIVFAAPKIGLVSNVTGKLAGDEVCDSGYWRRHVSDPVRFVDSIATLRADGYRVFVEVGPTPTLLGMAQRCAGSVDAVWLGSLRRGHDDLESMLSSLGELYVRGVPVNWHGLIGPAATVRRHADLPTYPFQRERHWKDLPPARRSGRLTAHPLLGTALASAVPIFEGEIGLATQPWLADHRISDLIPFPAAGFVDIMLAAAHEVLGAGAVMLRDLSITEALTLPEQGDALVQVAVTPLDADTHRVQVYSRGDAPAQADGPWRLHASALALPAGATEAVAHRDVAALLSRMPRHIAAADYYASLLQQGVDYGPTFRAIVQIALGEAEVLGRLELPVPAAGTAARHVVHPALLDACLQLVGALLMDDGDPDGDVYLPIGIESCRWHRAGIDKAWCHVRIREAGPKAPLLRADLSLLDDDNAVVATLDGLTMQRVARQTLQRAAAARQRVEATFEVAWQVAAPAAPTTTAGTRWLILCDGGGLGAALAAGLRPDGAKVALAHPGDAFGLRDDGWQIDASDPAQLRRLVDVVTREDGRPLDGIVSLCCLDAPATWDGTEAAHQRVLGDTLALAQALPDVAARLWVVTRGAQAVAGSLPDLVQAPAWALAGVIATELPALRCVRVDLAPQAGADEAAQLLDVVRAGGDEDRIALRGGDRYVARLVPIVLANGDEQPLRLEIRERGSLSNLSLERVPRERAGAGQVEIRVLATGLNFRDVLNTLGMYPGDPGPLGNECAGIVTAVGEGVTDLQVGDEVVAMIDRSFATWVVAPAAMTVRKPPALSFADAATVPVTFLTAEYALRHLSNIRQGERVLIHAITGGVGMAAMQLALRAGASVIGTAGSPAKRALALALGAHHVADSRSLSFVDDVMRFTGGQGVDIVLNSLAGHFIPASLGLLHRGGRFVEIGKTGIWDAASVAERFPRVEYHALYLGEVAAARPAFVSGLLIELLADIAAGTLKALPRRSYPLEQSEQAFRCMAQAQHTGKIVITQRRPISIRADASYLVTGGLGGLGLTTARWLADAGARHVVLAGRREPADTARGAIAALESAGVHVRVAKVDVAKREQLARLLADIDASMPPLRGILHEAGVIDDALLGEQNWQRFRGVMAPKVQGSWHLHELTLHRPLDFFVLFSSGASLLGSPGQGNYAAASAFQDALAHVRQAQGLPCTSINWGSWAEVGMAARVDAQHRRRWAAMGLGMIEPQEGMRQLHAVLKGMHSPQLAVMPLVRSRMPATPTPFFRELLGTSAKGPAAPADLLQGFDALTSRQRIDHLSAFLTEQVVRVLAPSGGSLGIDGQRSLLEMGMDSLMAMELRNRIQSAAKVRLPVTDLLAGPTIQELASTLLRQIEAAREPARTDDDREEVLL